MRFGPIVLGVVVLAVLCRKAFSKRVRSFPQWEPCADCPVRDCPGFCGV